VRETIRDIGYCDSELGFDYLSCAVMLTLETQSYDMAAGVNKSDGIDLDQCAGDQSSIFGYTCNETDVLMPMPIKYAHRFAKEAV